MKHRVGMNVDPYQMLFSRIQLWFFFLFLWNAVVYFL